MTSPMIIPGEPHFPEHTPATSPDHRCSKPRPTHRRRPRANAPQPAAHARRPDNRPPPPKSGRADTTRRLRMIRVRRGKAFAVRPESCDGCPACWVIYTARTAILPASSRGASASALALRIVPRSGQQTEVSRLRPTQALPSGCGARNRRTPSRHRPARLRMRRISPATTLTRATRGTEGAASAAGRPLGLPRIRSPLPTAHSDTVSAGAWMPALARKQERAGGRRRGEVGFGPARSSVPAHRRRCECRASTRPRALVRGYDAGSGRGRAHDGE